MLRDFDFRVEGGQSVALVGENGAGKSTLLQICAGVLPPDGGTVDWSGRIGYCPQKPLLFDKLTAREHFSLFGCGYGLGRAESILRGTAILETLGFPGGALSRTPSSDLSGGLQQKLNLALALLGDADILLLDEPYQGFDQGGYVNFWTEVESWTNQQRAVVIVTHVLTELHRVDRVVELWAYAPDAPG